MAGNQNSGRKEKEGAVRTSVIIDAEVYNYLSRNGNVSNEVERITREDMGTHPDTKSITLTRRSKLGWGWTYWTPEHPEPPTKPSIVGTHKSILEKIQQDSTYQLEHVNTYMTAAWFARVNGEWRRINRTEMLESLDWNTDAEVEIE